MEEYKQVEEAYGELPVDLTEKSLIITPHIMFIAVEDQGKLIGTMGVNVHAELIELNHVKVSKNGKDHFYELSNDVRWMEVE